MPTTAPTLYLTPRDVAELLGVDQGKVLAWIARGELAAVNVARAAGGKRARWRISRQSLDDFLAARLAQRPAPAPRRPRKQKRKEAPRYY